MLSVAKDANDNLLGTRVGVRGSFKRIGVGVRPGVLVSSILTVVLGWCWVLIFASNLSLARSGLTVFSFRGGDLGECDLAFFKVELLLVCDLVVELDGEFRLPLFEPPREEAIDVLLPSRRDSCSNVLMVSALEALDRSISDSKSIGGCLWLLDGRSSLVMAAFSFKRTRPKADLERSSPCSKGLPRSDTADEYARRTLARSSFNDLRS